MFTNIRSASKCSIFSSLYAIKSRQLPRHVWPLNCSHYKFREIRQCLKHTRCSKTFPPVNSIVPQSPQPAIIPVSALYPVTLRHGPFVCHREIDAARDGPGAVTLHLNGREFRRGRRHSLPEPLQASAPHCRALTSVVLSPPVSPLVPFMPITMLVKYWRRGAPEPLDDKTGLVFPGSPQEKVR